MPIATTRGGGLANIVEDVSPQLGADLDTNAFNIRIDSGKGIFDDANNEQLLFVKTLAATNYFEILNSATASGPKLSAKGALTDISLRLDAKGTGIIKMLKGLDVTGNITLTGLVDGEDIRALKSESEFCFFADSSESSISASSFLSNLLEDTSPQLGGDLDTNGKDILFDTTKGIRDDVGGEQLIFNKTTSAANHFAMTNAATGGGPTLSTEGTEDDVDLNINAKGSGGVKVASNVEVAGDLSTTGEMAGSRLLLHAADAASRTATIDIRGLDGIQQAAGIGYVMPRAGSIVSASWRAEITAVISNGTLRLRIFKNGTSVFDSASVFISSTGDKTAWAVQARGVDTFVAGDLIRFNMEMLTGSYTRQDVVALCEVVFDT